MRYLKSNILFIILTILAFSFQTANAQNNWCGQVEMEQRYMDEHPEKVAKILALKKQMNQEALAAESQRGSRAIKVIPVVFHILHLNGPENISDAQIMDQMRIMNEDYNMGNADLSDVVSSFVNIIGDVGVEFRLARKDPNGNVTDGIDRIYSTKTNSGGESAKINYWNRSMYLNIWVVKNWDSSIPSSVLAYSRTPSGAHYIPTKDGVIIKSQFVGSIGTGTPLFARTLTHEIGHYLNLSHTWGGTNNPGAPSNCNDPNGDYVGDTPKTVGSTSCNLSFNSCGSLDNVQNQMEYSFCSVMFTNGQAIRMNSALNSSVAQRNNLSTQGNLDATGVGQLSEADFVANRVTFCQGQTTDFTDKSKYDANAWSWSFPSGQASSNSTANPQVTYNTPGLFDVTLSASNGTQTADLTKVGYIMINPVIGKFVPYNEDFSNVSTLNHENWYSVNIDNDAYSFKAEANNGYDGTNCVKMDNHGNDNRTKDELLTTTYDLSIFSSIVISFKTSYAQTAPSDLSKLTLYISNDCGTTWVPRWTGAGSNLGSAPMTTSDYSPSGNQDWKTNSISSISGSVLAQNSQFKFVFENRDGNNLYFDDFNVTGTYTKTAQLKLPEDGRASLPNNQILYWKAIGNIDSYEYQVAEDLAFSSGLQTGINTALSIHEGLDTQFAPTGLNNGQTYYWKVRLIINGQPEAWSDTWSFTVASNGVSTKDLLIEKYDVKVYPNPMKNEGFVSFTLDKGSDVSVAILDMMGKERLLINKSYLGTGSHVFAIQNPNLPTGIYLIRINVNGVNIYQKIMIQ